MLPERNRNSVIPLPLRRSDFVEVVIGDSTLGKR